MNIFVTFERPKKAQLREVKGDKAIFIDLETGEELISDLVSLETIERIQRGEEPEFPGLIIPHNTGEDTVYWHVYRIRLRGKK